MAGTDIRALDEAYADYLRDESRRVGVAESISFPDSEAAVRTVLRQMAAAHKLVTVQGARTGITGGAVPAGGHVLNLSRMRRITGLRRDAARNRFFLTVQPGVLLSEVRACLHEREFPTADWTQASLDALAHLRQAEEQCFPPDPTEPSASIGGMVACNASGARSFFYGPTRNHVEALRVLLPDGDGLTVKRGRDRARGCHFRLRLDSGKVLSGEVPRYRAPAVKSAAGYHIAENMDLLDLFIGMEGTLGVVTELELALAPAPVCTWGIMCFLPDRQSALQLVRVLREEKRCASCPAQCRPVALEFFSRSALDVLRSQKQTNPAFSLLPALPTAPAEAVYVEYHGSCENEVVAGAESLESLLGEIGGNSNCTFAGSTTRELDRLQDIRHAVPEAVNLLIDERRKDHPSLTKLGTDMSVPNDRLDAVMNLYESGLNNTGLQGILFGHIGDNHVHVNILPRDTQDYEKGKALYLDWAREVVGMGGSVSAEHGIGKIKPDFLRLMLGDNVIAEMRKLRRTFDPEERLNRGNLFGGC